MFAARQDSHSPSQAPSQQMPSTQKPVQQSAFAVQLARHFGAEVTGVDGPDKLEMLRALGADHVIDYTAESFTRNGQRYDVILDLAAYRTVFESRRLRCIRWGTAITSR